MCMDLMRTIPKKNRGVHQAMNTDYVHSGYDKGHLYPVQHTSTYDDMLATSTLTNAAPQEPSFNRGKWNAHEGRMLDLNNQCSKVYIVTGVVPDYKVIPMNNRVRVAKYYWNAYCCVPKAGGKRTSLGYMGNSSSVKNCSLNDLEKILKKLLNKPFSVFRGKC